MFSGISGAGRDCRKISWFYNNINKNQEFWWSASNYSTTYANVILNIY